MKSKDEEAEGNGSLNDEDKEVRISLVYRKR